MNADFLSFDVDALRSLAEVKLAQRGDVQAQAKMTAENLLHELEVHQIELEMQNEALRQSQFELEKSRDRYMDFYDFSPIGYITLDEIGLITELNLTGASMLGMERNKIRHQRFSAFVTPEYQDHWYRNFQTALASEEVNSCELSLQRQDGSRFFARIDSLRLNIKGESPTVRLVLTDITERIKSEEEIRKLAFYDGLTLLPNRRLLNERLIQAMATSKRSGRYGALLFLDLDNFKPLNDEHGHNMGDLLLIEVARRITSCVREMDTVARFGGDEFVILLSELDTDEVVSITQAGQVAEKIRMLMAEPYHLETPSDRAGLVEHRCTSSIGIVLFFNHEASQDNIIKWADMAMYQAKAGGRNLIRFYESQSDVCIINQ
jgi:diguanylate cyclase (GGDEF)-like protein/PAS domain S-box-containing protein